MLAIDPPRPGAKPEMKAKVRVWNGFIKDNTSKKPQLERLLQIAAVG